MMLPGCVSGSPSLRGFCGKPDRQIWNVSVARAEREQTLSKSDDQALPQIRRLGDHRTQSPGNIIGRCAQDSNGPLG